MIDRSMTLLGDGLCVFFAFPCALLALGTSPCCCVTRSEQKRASGECGYVARACWPAAAAKKGYFRIAITMGEKCRGNDNVYWGMCQRTTLFIGLLGWFEFCLRMTTHIYSKTWSSCRAKKIAASERGRKRN